MNAPVRGLCVIAVDDIRSVSAQMLDEHFKEDSDVGRVGRVEYLPVRWHSALHGDATGIDRLPVILPDVPTPTCRTSRHFSFHSTRTYLFNDEYWVDLRHLLTAPSCGERG